MLRHNYLRATLGFLLNLCSAIDHRLNVKPHPLHPLELDIDARATISRWSDRQGISLLVAFLRDVDGVLTAGSFSDPSRWSRYRGVGRLYLVVVGGIRDLSLRCQLRLGIRQMTYVNQVGDSSVGSRLGELSESRVLYRISFTCQDWWRTHWVAWRSR